MIELRNVFKKFGTFTAVDGISLNIRAGEFLTLLGPSGCGKTTLLRMISGFESPDAGSVYLGEKDVTALPPYRREVNQVFQSYALFPHLTVQKNVEFGLKMKRLPRATIGTKAAAILKIVNLAGMEDRKPDQLSGGQRQRVALARALVCEPKVLLLDEPLAALDAKLRRSMQMELKRLQAKVGITFVFVTHDQEEAITMSDRIAVMNHGRIEQLGTPFEVYHRPTTRFVATFLGQTNLLSAVVVNRKDGTARVRLTDGTELSCDDAELPAGDDVLLSIRPEHVNLSGEPSENRIEVKLVERIFKGPFEQLLLRTAGGLELLAVVGAGACPQELTTCALRRTDMVALLRDEPR
jgi:spermidine/putrescine transport system ATP-binding protein